MDTAKDKIDAGLRSVDHYKDRLPLWRYHLREYLLPFIRWETPYVAWLQARMRSPALDTYFAISANLGTHTFFMIMLPVLFWCGYTSLGRGMVHVLAAGVYFSGFIKDLLCLPRPLSPPLQRITMSGSAALEYGFPSTHSTNAVSVAVYSLYILKYASPDMNPTINLLLQFTSYFYACSIILGRVYCGMHGFSDVIIGSLLGALIAVVQCVYEDAFDTYIHGGPVQNVISVVFVILVLIRIHPEPADDCPCYDDSVAFASVFLGVDFGNWHFAQTRYAWPAPSPGTVPFDLETLGWPTVVVRIMLGITTIFAWRGVMKPILLAILPPIYRVIEAYGLTLPRRFFKQASEYTAVPRRQKDDNVIPHMSEIPELLYSLRRRRAVSVGPQSEADAYEAMAYRDHRRRESLTSPGGQGTFGVATTTQHQSNSFQEPSVANGSVIGRLRSRSSIERFKSMMGSTSDRSDSDEFGPQANGATNEEKDPFSNLQKPRVRYDVEVVTKIIVYTGIAWLAVEFNPILFDWVGLSI